MALPPTRSASVLPTAFSSVSDRMREAWRGASLLVPRNEADCADYIALPLSPSTVPEKLDLGTEAEDSTDHDEDTLDAPDPPTNEMPARHFLNRRRLHILLVVALLVAFSLALASSLCITRLTSFSPFLPSSAPLETRVGSRHFAAQYYGRGCSSRELMSAVERSTVRPDGASRTESEPKEGVEGVDPNMVDLDTFRFSFDLDGCPPPHIFTPEEACDLLSAYGGVFTRGDSLMRQFAQGLFLLLGQTLDLVTDHKEECAGNDLFINSKTCRFYGINDASQIRHFCKGEPFVHYDQVWKFNSTNTDGTINDTPLLDSYHDFVRSLPTQQQQYSPVFVNGLGLHYNLRAKDTLDVHILPFLHNTSTASPRPVSFWSSYPAVGPNKPQRFMKKQGPGPTKKYNAAIRNALEELSPGEAYQGAWRQLEWYNVTDGAVSYDGTHYSYQVAMERAQIFLNTLDVVWGEIVEHGGLVQDAVQ